MDDWFGDIFKTTKKKQFNEGMDEIRKRIQDSKDKISRPSVASPNWRDHKSVVYNPSPNTWDELSPGSSSETVTCDKLKVDGIDVGATLKTLQSRFLILEEDFQKHEQYPALKAAYEQYKIIEKLLLESDKKAK